MLTRSPQQHTSPGSIPTDSGEGSERSWGVVTITLHWITALLVFGLFALGLWMTSLSYYDIWYKQGPFVHKGIGVTLFGLLVIRLLWRSRNQRPKPLESHALWERRLAHVIHILLYILMFTVIFSGYLISTADGRALEVFGWFEIPAVILPIENQEDIAGEIHFYLACLLIGTVALHIAGALKHHFVDGDDTLLRILRRR